MSHFGKKSSLDIFQPIFGPLGPFPTTPSSFSNFRQKSIFSIFSAPEKVNFRFSFQKKSSIEFREIIFSEFSFRPIEHPQIFASWHSNPKRKKTPTVKKSESKKKSKIPQFPILAPPPVAYLAIFKKKFDPREKFQKIRTLRLDLRDTQKKLRAPPTAHSDALRRQSRFFDFRRNSGATLPSVFGLDGSRSRIFLKKSSAVFRKIIFFSFFYRVPPTSSNFCEPKFDLEIQM